MRAGERGCVAHALVVGRRIAEADVVRDRAAEERRTLRHERRQPPPGRRVDEREVVVADEDPARGRLGEAEEQRDKRALPSPARPDDRERLARQELEVDARAAPRRRGPGTRTTTRSNGSDASAGSGRRAEPATRGRRVREVEEPLGDRRAVGARVELRGEVAERQVELRREHENGERRLEADPALGQPHADDDRDERDARASLRARGSSRRGTRRGAFPSSSGGTPR